MSVEHVVTAVVAQLRSPGTPLCTDFNPESAAASCRPDWTAAGADKARKLARDWTRQFAREIRCSCEPHVFRHCPLEFRRTVLCLLMLHCRPASCGSGFARLARSLILNIVSFLSGTVSILLWELTRAQFVSLSQ